MAKEKTPLCKWDKDQIKENLKELKKVVSKPQFICRKCARAASEDAYLCKPEPLEKEKKEKK